MVSPFVRPVNCSVPVVPVSRSRLIHPPPYVKQIVPGVIVRESRRKKRRGISRLSGCQGGREAHRGRAHASDGIDVIAELNRSNARSLIVYWAVVLAVILLAGSLVSWKIVWFIGIAAGVLSHPVGLMTQKRRYASIVRRTGQ